jgi:DNA-binding MarR family transcriptional regulator
VGAPDRRQVCRGHPLIGFLRAGARAVSGSDDHDRPQHGDGRLGPQRLGRHGSYAEGVTTSPMPQAPLEPEDVLALDRQVCFALSVAARNVVAVYRPVLEPLGLTHPQYLVMLALWQHGTLSVKELSGLLQLDPGTLSPLLKRLEAAGLLRRERDPRDQRNLALALTEKGAALREQAEKIPAGIVERLGMPVEQLMDLHAALTQVIAASQQALTHSGADEGAGPEATVA